MYTANCLQLVNPVDGMMSCSLSFSPLILYEDVCNFTCNTGYELTGSDTRTCQSDGSWSGSDVFCIGSTRGNLALMSYSENAQKLTSVLKILHLPYQ